MSLPAFYTFRPLPQPLPTPNAKTAKPFLVRQAGSQSSISNMPSFMKMPRPKKRPDGGAAGSLRGTEILQQGPGDGNTGPPSMPLIPEQHQESLSPGAVPNDTPTWYATSPGVVPNSIPPRSQTNPRALKRRPKGIAQIFQSLLDQVDEGTLNFSDHLPPKQLPGGIELSDLDDYEKHWRATTGDGVNLLHFIVKSSEISLDVVKKEDIMYILEKRLSLARWLLRSEPAMFKHANTKKEEALLYVIANYNAVGKDLTGPNTSVDDHLQKRFTNYFLSEHRAECRSILNNRGREGCVYSTPHTAIREMGIEIIPHLDLFDKESLLAQDRERSMPLHVALDVYYWREGEDGSEQRADLISRLIELCDDALTHKNGSDQVRDELRMAPYGYHKARCKEVHVPGDKACEKKSCKLVEFILKDAYMRQPEGKGAMKHLYSGKQALCCHLDLSELSLVKPPPTDFLKYIKESIDHLNLDTILKYVCLPKVPLLSGTPSDQEGCSDYSAVFQWLRGKNVKRIMKLSVEDDELLPHSDEVIEASLDGIEIHSWDWKQYDLCCDTILNAAPGVKEVFLYSTGKKAVLLNWTSEEGLKKLTKLEKITIQIDLRAMRGNSTFDYKSFVEKRIKDLRLGPGVTIDVRVNKFSKNKGTGGGRTSGVLGFGLSDGNQPDTWLQCMDRFGRFIYNIPEEVISKAGNPVVKIAIIDDGIDAHVPELRGAIIGGGTSFHTRGGLPGAAQETFTHHFPSTSGHGTEMAMRVRQVFPMATLYIARLNVRCGEGGHPTIEADSAAEAIRWATAEGVDIISMSWTVEKTENNGAELKRMEDAIDKAHNKNILMFCAAKDGGYAQSVSFGYPKRFNKPVFCIGASTEHGDLSASLGSQKEAIDFAFPGENITPLSRGAGSKIAGSSIATALAAGLAGLLLYIIQFEDTDEKSAPGVAPGVEWRRSLQRHEKMKDTLISMTNNQQKYIPVLKYFDVDSKNEWGTRTAEPTFYDLVKRIRYMSTPTSSSRRISQYA